LIVFGHLWSLSIEEQFYLLWPPLLILMLRRSRIPPLKILTGVIVALAAWTVALILLGATEERIYLGTDTRADMLLIGCGAALARSGGYTKRFQAFMSSHWWLQMAPLAAVVAVMVANEPYARTAWIGFLSEMGVSLIMVVALAALIDAPKTPIASLLARRPLVWLGQRSYEIYLWHFPIVMVLARTAFGIQHGSIRLVVFIALSVTAAELTHLVVAPIQRRRPSWANRTPKAIADSAMAAVA
jgi:peptidoglycan/LPS O-acetylase OafA/YrhL